MVELNHPEVNQLARELAMYTGENLTQVVVNALRERLVREQKNTDCPNPLYKMSYCVLVRSAPHYLF